MGFQRGGQIDAASDSAYQSLVNQMIDYVPYRGSILEFVPQVHHLFLLSMFYFCNIDLILIVAMLTLAFLMHPIGASQKMIVDLEERVIEVEGELCKALACASKVKLAFREERDRVDALSRSSVHLIIKLGEMHL